MGVIFVNDAPLTLATSDGDTPTSRIQVAEAGTFRDPARYGKFRITQEDFAAWKQMLSSHFQGRVPIDLDHSTDRGGSSEAAGWIVSLDQNGPDGQGNTPKELWATVEWTPLGESAIKEKRYRHFSPVFVNNLRDKAGKALGKALLRGALTNSPFLHDMPAVSLSAPATFAERVDEETDAAADSRPRMPELAAKVAEKLELDADADEATILDAITALQEAKPSDDDAEDKRTLDQRAAEEGKVVLDAAALAELQANAAQGVNAAAELRETRFNTAFDKALSDGRVDAKPETKELHKAIFDKDEDASIKLLDSLPKVVALDAPRGAGGHIPRTNGQPIDPLDKADVDETMAEVDAKATALAASENIDYKVALNRVLDEVGV